MSSHWRSIDTGPQRAAYNMAVDEELLARHSQGSACPSSVSMPGRRPRSPWDGSRISVKQLTKMPASGMASISCGAPPAAELFCTAASLPTASSPARIIRSSPPPYSAPTRLSPPDWSPAFGTSDLAGDGDPATADMLRSSQARSTGCRLLFFPFLVRDPRRRIARSPAARSAGSANAFLQHGSILLDHDAALEAEVIRGARTGDVVTSINREAGRAVLREEAAEAILKGFRENLGISFLD